MNIFSLCFPQTIFHWSMFPVIENFLFLTLLLHARTGIHGIVEEHFFQHKGNQWNFHIIISNRWIIKNKNYLIASTM